MMNIPKCVFHVITQYAWGQKINFQHLQHDLDKVSHIKECIPDLFLAPCVWLSDMETHVPNPFRQFFPYFPVFHVNQHSVFNNLLLCLGYSIEKQYFERVKSYRQIFIRYSRAVCSGCIYSWNLLLARYGASLDQFDINMSVENRRLVTLAFGQAAPVASKYLF